MIMICKHCKKRMSEWAWENHSCPSKRRVDRIEVVAFLKREGGQNERTSNESHRR
jgi:hypothetical protein